jgi:hypothetical protein
MGHSYSVSIWCGCRVYVSCHPVTGTANARIVERRGDRCPDRRHHIGARLWLWELLPDGRVTDPLLTYEGAAVIRKEFPT